MVSSPYLLQPTLNQFPSDKKVRNEICADSVQYRHIHISKCTLAVEHSASRPLPAISWQFQDPPQQFPFHLITGLRPAFIICAALLLSEVAVHCLLHGLLGTHLLIHSWCDSARNRVGTVIGRWRSHRSICVSRHLQLRTGGFCWCKVLLPTCPCWRQPAHSDYGEDWSSQQHCPRMHSACVIRQQQLQKEKWNAITRSNNYHINLHHEQPPLNRKHTASVCGSIMLPDIYVETWQGANIFAIQWNEATTTTTSCKVICSRLRKTIELINSMNIASSVMQLP